MPAGGVCFDAVVAVILAEAGIPVVVLCRPGTAGGPGLPATPPPAMARICVLVGHPDDPGDQAAAMAMAAELFGAEPFVVVTAAQARQITAAAGHDRSPTQLSGTVNCSGQ